jgi:hypothetical protein
MMTALSILLILATATACKSSTAGTSAAPPAAAGATHTAAAAAGGGGAGVCSYLTPADVNPLFSEPVKAGVAGTFNAPNGGSSAECDYQLQSDNTAQSGSPLGLNLVVNPPYDAWKTQFVSVTPLAGIGDSAFYAGDGLVVVAKKGSKSCMAQITISKPTQLNAAQTDDYGVAPSAQAAYAAKLGALCTKMLG